MNKIPKCTRKMIPLVKAIKKPSKRDSNDNKLKILNNKPNVRSFGNDITNIIKNKEIKITKKSVSCNEKVNKYL